MCGIAAVIKRAPGNADAVTALTKGLSHRGPDGSGVQALDGGRVSLGHRRLAILDLSSAGAQPMFDAAGEISIVYNGEIFNFQELRNSLKNQGTVFRSQTDTEVLLELYRRDGIRMLRLLRGMYAFVLYDGRSRDTYVARDPFGIKPLYRRDFPDGVAFSSEPGPLRQFGPVSVDTTALVRSLIFRYPPGSNFGVCEIKRVPPGTVYVFDHTLHERCVPSGPILPDGRGADSRISMADTGMLSGALEQAVKEHLTSDVPVGIMFSGGLDSSIIAAFAARHSPKPVRLFSMLGSGGLRSERLDDPDHIRRCASLLNLPLSSVAPPDDLLETIRQVVSAIGEPVADPASLAAFAVARQARAEGHVVLLSGHGADELFGGYRRHWLARFLLPHPLLAHIVARAAGSMPRTDLRRLSSLIGSPQTEWAVRLQGLLADREIRQLVSEECFEESRHTLLEPFQHTMDGLDGASELRRSMALDVRTYLCDQNLNYFDKVGMAHGVEGRLPYVTPPVVSLAATLTDDHLVGWSENKIALRRVAASIIPPEILSGPKRGFGLPLRDALVRRWGEIASGLRNGAGCRVGFWNKKFLKDAERVPLAGLALPVVFNILVIEAWLAEWA